MKEKLHAKRAATEEHIRELEKEGKAGERYTITMPDTAFMFLGLLCDIGWALQLIFGNWFFNRSIDQAVSPGAKTVVAIDLFLILAGACGDRMRQCERRISFHRRIPILVAGKTSALSSFC